MKFVEPIRNVEDIEAIKHYFKYSSSSNPNTCQRNYMLFLTGINIGLRVSDLLRLRVRDVKNKEYIEIIEAKTGKQKKVYINPALAKELKIFIKGKHGHYYLFQSRKGKNRAIKRGTVHRLIKTATTELEIPGNFSTHSMRKTFGYHFYLQFGSVADLMEMFNHSNEATTLKYIGVTQDEQDKKMKKFGL